MCLAVMVSYQVTTLHIQQLQPGVWAGAGVVVQTEGGAVHGIPTHIATQDPVLPCQIYSRMHFLPMSRFYSMTATQSLVDCEAVQLQHSVSFKKQRSEKLQHSKRPKAGGERT